LSVGDEVEAMVLNIKKDEAKISLGIKQTEFNPWSVVEEKYPPGTRVRGKVRNITSYGAFVELEEGIDGLIHISDMSWTRKINHPSEMLKRGEMTEAIVLAVDQEAKKITLGLKQLEANPWETIDIFIRVGSLVEATVTKIADFGVFATLENGIECLIHISQLSDRPFQKIEDIVKRGDKVLAKVDRIDRQRRKIALSIREYQRDVRLAEEEAAREAAKALSLGDQSITGMKEHLEQAMEEYRPPAQAPDLPQDIQEQAPVADEVPATEVPVAEEKTPLDVATGPAAQETEFAEESQQEELQSESAPETEPPTPPKDTPAQQVTFWGDEFVKPAEQVGADEESLPGEEPHESVAPDARQPELPFEVEEPREQADRSEAAEELPEAKSPDRETAEDEPPKTPDNEPAP
jgi:predicted RNA-binding protein with RPS1 domain